MGDYDYYEEPQPVPTFSDGSTSGGRGANFRAAASRASASKSAVSAASRASAIMAASIQQLPKNSIITSNGIRNIQQPSGPGINIAAIKVAQRRSEEILKTVKPPEPIIIRQPIEFVGRIPSSTVILETTKPEIIFNKLLTSSKYTSEVYSQAVKASRARKEELLTSLETTISSKKTYAPVKYIRHAPVIEDPSINQGLLNELASNLSMILRSNDKAAILEEFNKYQTSLRISIEEPYYKSAIQQFRLNKQAYLTSDA